MDYFPVFLNLKQARALVVGGGPVAARKVELLRSAGARIFVVAETLCPDLQEYRDQGELEYTGGDFHETLLRDCAIAVAATSDRAVNREVARLCRERGIPVNVVDDPDLCSFITPAILDRSPLVIALSTGGAAPVLARQLKARLATFIPPAYGRLARLAGDYREEVKRMLSGPARRRFWERVFDGPVAEDVLAGRQTRAATELHNLLQKRGEDRQPAGEVYLVGGGPGDPDLLTFRALRLMQQADVVLHDRLVSEQVLALVRKDAERIDVGKRKSRRGWTQDDINAKLLELASRGWKVLRLKGGDPFVFGRGGEEMEVLAAHGIAFQIVPGISAAQGCAAYSGIPLTHRDHAHSVQFVTAHPRADGSLGLDWKGLVRADQTLVFYMGRSRVDQLCRELVKHGLPDTHPAALVEYGTRAEQRVFQGTLRTLPGKVGEGSVEGPSLIIAGEVASLHERLAWFQPQQRAPQD